MSSKELILRNCLDKESFVPDGEKAYIFSPFGIGDTYLLCSMKKLIEDRTQLSVVYLIKPSHVSILEMYGYEYEVVRFEKEYLLELSHNSKEVAKGKIFVAHPIYVDESLANQFYDKKIPFIDVYRRMFFVDACQHISLDTFRATPSKTLLEKIKPYAIEEITVFAPEINSAYAELDKPSSRWVISFSHRLKADGRSLIVNTQNEEYSQIEGEHIDLSLMELIELASNCKEVISVRSGLCDVICNKAKKMKVIYADLDYYEMYSLKSIYGSDVLKNVNEVCISYAEELRAKGLGNCAIYGMGKNGVRLARTLQIQGFPVLYGIDKRNGDPKIELTIYSNESKLPKVDCILISLKHIGEDDIEKLRKNSDTDCIFSIWDMEYTELLFDPLP